MSFGNIGGKTATQKNKAEPQVRTSPLVFQRVKPTLSTDIKSGRKITFLGQSTTGKSTMLILMMYYNQEYLPQLERHKDKFPYVVESLKKGYLPDITEALFLESENNLMNALQNPNTIENVLARPFLEKECITIVPYTITDQGRIVKDGKVIDLSRVDIDEVKQTLKDKIMELSDECIEHTLYGIDSGTKVKGVFDKGLKKIVDTIKNREHASLDGIEKFSMLFYGDRNVEWEDMYEYLRGCKAWVVTTFKEKKTPKWVFEKQPDADEESTKWVNGTEFLMDFVWRIRSYSDGTRTVEPVFGRNLPTKPDRLKPFKFPLESRFGAMPILDRICEKVVEYGGKEPEDFWKV